MSRWQSGVVSLYLASPIVRKTAALTSQAITDLLSDFKAVVHTITYDNGREFNGHQAINQALAVTAISPNRITAGSGD